MGAFCFHKRHGMRRDWVLLCEGACEKGRACDHHGEVRCADCSLGTARVYIVTRTSPSAACLGRSEDKGHKCAQALYFSLALLLPLRVKPLQYLAQR